MPGKLKSADRTGRLESTTHQHNKTEILLCICILIICYHNKIHLVWTWNIYWKQKEREKAPTQKNRQKIEPKKNEQANKNYNQRIKRHNRQYKYLLCCRSLAHWQASAVRMRYMYMNEWVNEWEKRTEELYFSFGFVFVSLQVGYIFIIH